MKLFLFYIPYHGVTVIIRSPTATEASKQCLDYLMYGDVDFDFTEGDFCGIEPIEISSDGRLGLVYSDATPLPESYKQLLKQVRQDTITCQ